MTLLYRVLFAHKCTSTHHKLAMDALQHLRHEHADRWGNLFLRHIEGYLDGAKAPDRKFKDFRNHVLHVRDNYWGGVVPQAEKWYARLVDTLRASDWPRAVYAAGVLSHYYTDPIMPLHTGQTEAEGAIHRALEWSVAKSFDDLHRLIGESGGYPDVYVPDGDDWLALMIVDGAEIANRDYEALVSNYDLDKGVDDPPAGLNQDCRLRIARLLGHAAIGLARILDHAFSDAGVEPPDTGVSLQGYLASLTIPIFWVTRTMADSRDRAIVTAMYRELQSTGRVLDTLPEDDRTVRRLHAEEVLGIDVDEIDRKYVPSTGRVADEHADKDSAEVKTVEQPDREHQPALQNRRTPAPAPTARVEQQKNVERQKTSEQTKRIEQPVQRRSEQRESVRNTVATESATASAVQPAAKPVQPREPIDRTIPSIPVPAINDVGRVTDAPREPIANPLDRYWSDIADDSGAADQSGDASADDVAVDNRTPGNTIDDTKGANRDAAVVQSPSNDDFDSDDDDTSDDRPSSPRDAQVSTRFYLDTTSPIVDAPSIGPKTARRLKKAGIRTVANLLDADPDAVAAKLNVHYITGDNLRDWQDQSELMCQIPGLRGHDAQILVGCGFNNPRAISAVSPRELLEMVELFCDSVLGKRVLRDAPPPDIEEIRHWIEWAGQSRVTRAA